MKSAWRARISKRSAFVVCSLSILCGCQTWSPSNWGVPTGTRVPPPPTGSYQHQGAYYNNPATGIPTGAATSATSGTTAAPVKVTSQNMPSQSFPSNMSGAPVVQASAVNPLNQSNPRTQINSGSNSGSNAAFGAGMPATSIGFPPSGGQVSTAGYTDNGTGIAEVVSASSLHARPEIDPRLQNGNVEISANSDGANLQWK